MAKLSIITPATHESRFIDDAIGSVPSADGITIEHLVVYDGDAGFFASLAARHPHLVMLRGDGRGATDAINKAIKTATGDYLLFLHSDDWVVIDDLPALLQKVAGRPEIPIWTGETRIIEALGDGRRHVIREIRPEDTIPLTYDAILNGLPLWNGRLYHRSVYQNIGLLDADFDECSDREFVLRILMRGLPTGSIDGFVYNYRSHAGSRTMAQGSANRARRYIREHLRLADTLCARADTPPLAVEALERWRQSEALRLAYHETKAGHWRDAVALIFDKSAPAAVSWRAIAGLIRASMRRHGVGKARS